MYGGTLPMFAKGISRTKICLLSHPPSTSEWLYPSFSKLTCQAVVHLLHGQICRVGHTPLSRYIFSDNLSNNLRMQAKTSWFQRFCTGRCGSGLRTLDRNIRCAQATAQHAMKALQDDISVRLPKKTDGLPGLFATECGEPASLRSLKCICDQPPVRKMLRRIQRCGLKRCLAIDRPGSRRGTESKALMIEHDSETLCYFSFETSADLSRPCAR